ncbi:metalloreductase STEAP1 [Brachionus plicatilis]|uniref:Metalloreductase STEAP1 n=1 Tax=Brachionus plicatilis TaxID=10195 RepID=A0A3M7RNF4_BRAPC|nr:metalloreductase STEAP1 [Brachionus plicatilis]
MFLSDYSFSKKETNFKVSLTSLITKSSGFTALYLLSFIYFGPVVASIYQIKNGIGYQNIPKWLERFFKRKKQFALWGFVFATVHAMLSMVILNANYFGSWFEKSDEKSGKMTLNGELSTISGVLAYLLLVLVASSSINSIEDSLNKSEWNFVDIKIGLSCLLIGVLHNFSMVYGQLDLIKELTLNILMTKFVTILFPFTVIMLRISLNYGPLKRKIEKVKNGEIINKKMENDKINV